MQFIQYINLGKPSLCRFKISQVLATFMSVLLLLGCSMKPVNDEIVNDSAEVKSIGKRIVDLLEFPTNDTKEQNSQQHNIKQINSTSTNKYLEQEALLMRGIPNDAVNTFAQAILAMEEKKWDKALTLFDEVIAQYENSSSSYVNQAIIWNKLSDQETKKETIQQQHDKSDALLDKAISVNSANPYAHLYKGEALQTKGQFELAQHHYESALAIWPNYPQAQLNMAVLLELYRGQLLEANKYYTAYLSNNAEDKQVKRWQAALAIKIKRAGLETPVQEGE